MNFQNMSISVNDDIFELCRQDNRLKVKVWLDNTENDPNQSDEHMFTPVHWAAMHGHTNLVDILVTKGAKIPLTNMGEDTPLHLAVQFKRPTTTKLLLERIKSASNSSSDHGFYSATDIINSQNSHGNTALHYAAFNNDFETLNLLLEYGAWPNLENNGGKTPRQMAKKSEIRARLEHEIDKENHNTQSDNRKSHGNTLSNKTTKPNYMGTIGSSGIVGSGTMLRIGQITMKHDNIVLESLVAKGRFNSDIIHEYLRYKWNKEEVVVKLIKASNEMLTENKEGGLEIAPRISRTFAEEYLKLRIFSNQYIIPVLGIVNNPLTIGVVYPYMAGGSLHSILHQSYEDETVNPVDATQLYKWLLNVANGMAFLHSLNEKEQLAGFQLNPHHVFIDVETNHAKLNMGDTLFTFQQTPNRSKFLNPAYLSPEVLQKPPGEVNLQAAHMWSFAVCLYEIETRQIPFYGLSPMEIGLKVSFEGLRLELESAGHGDKLFRICMNEDVGKRPKFEQIVPVLDKLIKR